VLLEAELDVEVEVLEVPLLEVPEEPLLLELELLDEPPLLELELLDEPPSGQVQSCELWSQVEPTAVHSSLTPSLVSSQ
jgi:hypothetical protein